MTKRKEQAMATKNKIFTCAMELFSKNTFELITVRDICQAADVSVGAFYHHFSSKSDIIDQGYQLFDDKIQNEWKDHHSKNPLDAIRSLIFKQNDSLNSIGLQSSLQLFKNQLTCGEQYILNKNRFFYQELIGNVKKAIDLEMITGNAEEITDELLSVSRGIAYDWCLHKGSYSLEERTRKTTDMVLQYYKKQSE